MSIPVKGSALRFQDLPRRSSNMGSWGDRWGREASMRGCKHAPRFEQGAVFFSTPVRADKAPLPGGPGIGSR